MMQTSSEELCKIRAALFPCTNYAPGSYSKTHLLTPENSMLASVDIPFRMLKGNFSDVF